MKHYTGLSLSFCIKDICANKVNIDQVDKIITGTMANSESDWDNLINSYCEYYWYDDPDKAVEILNTLRQSGRIYQPRLEGKESPEVYDGYWLYGGVKVRI